MPRSSRGFSRGPRRQRSWEEGPGGTTTLALTAAVPLFVGAAAVATEDGLTLARLRGRVRVFMDTWAAGNNGLTGAFGIGIVREEAVVAGIASVPTPIADSDWDGWIYWTPYSVRSIDAAAASVGGGFPFGVDYEVDTRAMRKLRLGDTIYASVESVISGTPVARMQFDSRVLVLLP